MVELDIISKNKSWYFDVTDSGNFTDSVWTSLWVFDSLMRLLWSLLMLLFSFNTWLSDFNYSRQPSLSEIPAQHLTVNSERRTQWLTHLSQVPYLSACVWTRLDCCTHSFRVRPTHNHFTCSSKVSSPNVTFMLLWWNSDLTLWISFDEKENQISPFFIKTKGR